MKLVLLPGLDGTGILFQPFVDALPKEVDFQIISYSPNEPQTYSELVDYVMDNLPNERYVLVGESFSGPIAYQIALRKPQGLESVVFVATFLENPHYILLMLLSVIPVNTILVEQIQNIIAKVIVGPTTKKEITDLFKRAIKTVNPAVIKYRLQEIGKLKKQGIYCGVKSTYIQPTHDRLVPKSSADTFARLCNRLTVYKVEGSHFILQTNPIECSRIIAREMAL